MPANRVRNQRFIGRQAILDQKMFLFGYEYLFRDGPENTFRGDFESATNQMIDSCLSMVACSTDKKFFINCTHDALVSKRVQLLPSRRVVLERWKAWNPTRTSYEHAKNSSIWGLVWLWTAFLLMRAERA
jgi:c-di-GMP-related signal transduction protein